MTEEQIGMSGARTPATKDGSEEADWGTDSEIDIGNLVPGAFLEA